MAPNSNPSLVLVHEHGVAPASADVSPRPRKPQGFACLTPAERHELAVRGGRATQSLPHARRWTPGCANAIEAGRKGGLLAAARRRAKHDAQENA